MTREEYEAGEPKQEETKRNGFVPVDDMKVGENYLIYGKEGKKRNCRWSGMGFTLKAINLPFFVVETAMGDILTVDCRQLLFISASPEFIAAQGGRSISAAVVTPPPIPNPNATIPFAQSFIIFRKQN